MATDDPFATAVTTTPAGPPSEPPPPGEPVPDAPPPATPAVAVPPPPPGTWTGDLRVVAFLLGVFVFLLGSFRAANSDIWLALATGRLVTQGNYQFGVDPFSWASHGAYWANNSWLSSTAFYLIYSGLGGMSLVLFKALLILALALVLILHRPKDASVLTSLALTGLAILVASPRFLLQSYVISYLALGILLWLLTRGGYLHEHADNAAPRRHEWWQIPLLFWIWSNSDGFFTIGLLALALVIIGLACTSATRNDATRLAGIWGLSVVACMANPHLWSNFAMPIELAYLFRSILPSSWVAGGVAVSIFSENDIVFYQLFPTLSSQYLGNLGWNFAGLSYFILLSVNVLSFVGAIPAPKTKGLLARGLVCIALGLLSLAQMRLIPLYAVVAGAITILNLADMQRWRREAGHAPLTRYSPGTLGVAAGIACGIL